MAVSHATTGDVTGTSAATGTRTGGTPVVHAVLDVLVRWGVRRLYCCPGSTEAPVLDALATRDDVELVLVTHESVAVSMAEGEARTTGRPAVAYLHTHLGLANGLAHLGSAQLSRSPVVLLNGLKAASLAGRDAFTSLTHPRDMVRQHVKWAHASSTTAAVADDVDRALHTASTEPAGPVWVGLAQDLLESREPVPAPRPRGTVPGTGARPAAASVAAAAELLAGARRPVLVAGADAVRRHAVGAVLELGERLGAPVFDEGRRDFLASAVPTAHPLHAGSWDPASPAARDADVVAFLGCRMFTEFDTGMRTEVPPAARLLHVHSDPAEVGRLHPVEVGVVGDPAAVLADLLAALPPARSDVRSAVGSPAVTPQPAPPADRFPGHRGLDRVVAALAEAVERTGATVVLDATTATVPLLRGLRTTRPGQLLSTTSGSLGWGTGAALGVALADPGTPVLAVLGDGAFQFGVQAAWTANATGARVTVVVLDNGVYSAVASALHRFGGAAVARDSWPGTDISGPDLAAVARGFGVPARRLPAAELTADLVAEALRGPGPAVLDVLTGPDDPRETSGATSTW